jgi:hypothetical protein
MRKNWFKQGLEDYGKGRVSLTALLVMAGKTDEAREYAMGRAAAKRQGNLIYFTDGPGANRIARYMER